MRLINNNAELLNFYVYPSKVTVTLETLRNSKYPTANYSVNFAKR